MKNKNIFQKDKGFTLIEMLVVIIIIGILATIVLISVASARKKAQATKAKTDLLEFTKAFEMAANSGCGKVTFNSNGQLICTPSGTSTSITLVALPAVPAGSDALVRLNSNDSWNHGSGWSATIADRPVSEGYLVSAYGFSNGEMFICTDGNPIYGAWATRSPGCWCAKSGSDPTPLDGGCTQMK